MILAPPGTPTQEGRTLPDRWEPMRWPIREDGAVAYNSEYHGPPRAELQPCIPSAHAVPHRRRKPSPPRKGEVAHNNHRFRLHTETPEMSVSTLAPSRFSTPQKRSNPCGETSFQRPPRPRGLGENRVEKAVVSAFRSAPYRLGLSVGCCCPGLGFSERVVGPDRGVLGPTPHLGRVQIQRISLAIARRPGPGHFGAMLGCGPNMQSAAPVAGRICRAAGRRSVAAGMEYRPLDRSVR